MSNDGLPIVVCSSPLQARLYGKLKAAADTQQEEWAEAAEQSWRELIDQNPDSQDYYKGFLANAGIDLGNAPKIYLYRRNLTP